MLKNRFFILIITIVFILIVHIPSYAGEKYSGMKVLNVGLMPAEAAQEAIKENKAFLETIEKRLGIKVEGYVTLDYPGLIEAMKAKKIDVGHIPPFSYIMFKDFAKIEAFATFIRADTGKPYYNAIFIAHKDSDIRSVKDLKGKTFAFVDVQSTSGYYMPRYMMLKAGIDPEKDLKGYVFSGGHDSAALAVYKKTVDAAMVAEVLYNKMIGRGLIESDKIRVLAYSDPILLPPYCYRQDLPEDLKKDLLRIFLNIKGITAGGVDVIAGFVPVKDSDYDGVRELVKILKLDLGELTATESKEKVKKK